MNFSPTPQDVERYRRLRALSMELHNRMVKTIPRQVFHEIGERIGILHDGTLVLETEDVSCVLMDCCLYDWYENGKNLVQRYTETHSATPGTDESFLFDAFLQAKYRILVPRSAVPGAGLHCQDVLNGGELFLMDIASSRMSLDGGMALATRTIPLGEYWMTSGAGLPVNATKTNLDILREISVGSRLAPKYPGDVSLSIVRACLAAGAAERIAYENPKPELKASPRHHTKHRPKRRR